LKVSIVIPTYKRPDYLERLLESIEQQTFQDFEVIVVDDNSPNLNDYDDVIKKYQEIFDEFSFITKDENKGAPHSRNIGIKKSKYELIALVDDDDEWLPLKLEKQVKVFEEGTDKLGLVYTWTQALDENNNQVYLSQNTLNGNQVVSILKNCFMISASVMVLKKAIIDVGLFDETFPSCQDWEMWTRILNKYECDYVSEILTVYYKHSNDSIGLSKNALIGYKKYYIKNMFLAFRKLTLIDFIKYIKSFIGIVRKIRNEKN